ncbi:TMEM165/GDT1 family protein [Streptomyces sp. ACA25]|uniref:TMEM165/GDT1 family protein n=1 Tax=Streptomyces sp. ACA25 TaxID=3022596 RepID=UPI0023076590|nr:TMEM165/GDT1 family protein [Streptomyces sp. ACA25]MDB1087770.1 TMEM165/GDT1 family protein [Streptomyces sp. ACA25]
MIDFTAVAVVFGLIVIAELPDKTTLAGLMLSTRFRPSYVFAGAATAFVLHVALSVGAGSLLTLLPDRLLRVVVAALFLTGAALLLFRKEDGDGDGDGHRQPAGQSFWKVAGTSFGIILVAEFGDMSQIMMANFTAHYQDPLSVALGSVAALWTVAALGIMGGRALLRVVPLHLLTRVAAGAMLMMASLNIYQALTG